MVTLYLIAVYILTTLKWNINFLQMWIANNDLINLSHSLGEKEEMEGSV